MTCHKRRVSLCGSEKQFKLSRGTDLIMVLNDRLQSSNVEKVYKWQRKDTVFLCVLVSTTI